MIPYYKYFGMAMATAFAEVDDNCYTDELFEGGDEDTKSCAGFVYTAFLIILIGLGASASLVFAGLKGAKKCCSCSCCSIALSVICLVLSIFQGALPIERADLHMMFQALVQFSTWPLAFARSLCVNDYGRRRRQRCSFRDV
jgi:hypothetical protein